MTERERERVEYKPVVGYEEYYHIYADGRVWSVRSKKFLKPRKDCNGYLLVCLCVNGISKMFKIHRLIGIHFISNPDNKECIDHIDGNPLNNNIYNLRWATRTENNRNRKKNENNQSGTKNICRDKQRGKWRVQFSVDRKQRHFGYFEDKEDACRFADAKRIELHGEFAREN